MLDASKGAEGEVMDVPISVARRVEPQPLPVAQELTLLDLVRVVGEVARNEDEVVATVLHLLRSGRVRLRGNFRGESLDCF